MKYLLTPGTEIPVFPKTNPFIKATQDPVGCRDSGSFDCLMPMPVVPRHLQCPFPDRCHAEAICEGLAGLWSLLTNYS